MQADGISDTAGIVAMKKMEAKDCKYNALRLIQKTYKKCINKNFSFEPNLFKVLKRI